MLKLLQKAGLVILSATDVQLIKDACDFCSVKRSSAVCPEIESHTYHIGLAEIPAPIGVPDSQDVMSQVRSNGH